VAEERPEPRRAGRSEQSTESQRSAPAQGDGEGQGSAAANLSEIMGQVARSLQREHGDVEAVLQAITSAAVGAVPGAEECSISYVVGRRSVQSRAATGDLALRADELQDRDQEGPCLDAVWEQQTVRIDDMTAEPRWPRFARDAAGIGVGSSLSFQLFVEGDNLGGLNVYSRSAHAFGEESEDIGLVFASHAAVALAGAEQQENLTRAVRSRDLIGQAKGILMERYKLTADQAFQLLARTSQATNRKLTDIADELAATGVMPGS
jgi:GAF domain-containing protein